MSSAPAGVDMAKSFCDAVIYAILANDDPKEYPLSKEPSSPLANPISTYSPALHGSCNTSRYGTVPNCDCSDPENYSFYDEGRFKILKVK